LISHRSFGRSRSSKFKIRLRRYRIERSSNNGEDAGLGFAPLLRGDKRAKVEAYGTQPRQRQRQETRKTPEKN
jgi:hypothetical protein